MMGYEAGLHRKRLRDNAESFGERIDREKPSRQAQRIGRLWDAWHAEPKSVEKSEQEARKKVLAA